MFKILTVAFLVCLLAVPVMAGQEIQVTWGHMETPEKPTPEGFKIYSIVDGAEDPSLTQDVVGAVEPYSYTFDIGLITAPITFSVEMTSYTQYAESDRVASTEITIDPPAPGEPYDVIVIEVP